MVGVEQNAKLKVRVPRIRAFMEPSVHYRQVGSGAELFLRSFVWTLYHCFTVFVVLPEVVCIFSL